MFSFFFPGAQHGFDAKKSRRLLLELAEVLLVHLADRQLPGVQHLTGRVSIRWTDFWVHRFLAFARFFVVLFFGVAFLVEQVHIDVCFFSLDVWG